MVMGNGIKITRSGIIINKISCIILIIFLFSGCISKKEIKGNDINEEEFVFSLGRWYLNLPYEVDYDNVEYMRFDLNKMRRTDIEKYNYYVLNDDETGLYLTSNNSAPYYVQFDINTGELIGKFVFYERIHSAIDFIEILVDGRRQPFFNRKIETNIAFASSPNRNNFSIREITEQKNEYFITMHSWSRIGQEGIFWWEGEGPNEPFKSKPWHSRGIYISSKSKTLDITYRIILPYPSMTIENLYDKNYKYKNYSKVYKIRVNLEDFFNSDSFRLGKINIPNN